MTPAPRRTPTLAPAGVRTSERPDGALVLESVHPLGEPVLQISERLRHWAERAPDRVFLAERDGPTSFREVRYAEARTYADALSEALLERGLSVERPLMILSENSVDHALLTLGAMQAGIPVAPISAAYSLMSRDHAKLRQIHELVAPGLVYAADATRFERAFEALGLDSKSVVTSTGKWGHSSALRDLLAAKPGYAAADAYARVGPSSICKLLFTSGSTGKPKGVINTQRMLCANQQAIVTLWPFLRERPPVVVDWLPWSHTFGANHNFNMVLFNGGTLYVDEGKPAPGLIEKTVANLRAVSPTLYFNVPKGFDMLLPFLEKDDALRRTFFRELDALFYAAASLPQPLWDRLERASELARGDRVCMLSAWGLTETSPLATSVHFPIERAGVIGLPAPGTQLKLARVAGKRELRVRGPNVTPGYWKMPELTRAAFDEEGFFKTGDAAKLRDEADPAQGVVFDGRIAEDFKLSSGTWVHVGAMKTAVVAATQPIVQDVVIAGLDRAEVGVLFFLSPGVALGLYPDVHAADLATHAPLQERLRAALRAHNEANPYSSMLVARAMVLIDPPNIDADEITDKGYINQRAVLTRRAELVERLYAGDHPAVIVVR